MTTNPHADSAPSSTTQTAQTIGTVQTSIPDDAVIEDVLHILEDNREIAAITYRQERFYPTRIKSELQTRFGWDVDKDTVRAAIRELGADTVRRCAQPHPNGR